MNSSNWYYYQLIRKEKVNSPRWDGVPGDYVVIVGQQYLVNNSYLKKANRPRQGPMSPELTQ